MTQAHEVESGEHPEVGHSELAGRYLTIALGDEQYGIEILKIQEIIGVPNITTVPRTPDYIKGVINLRGKIIPVLDLRLKVGIEERAYDKKTCVVVVTMEVEEETIAVGVIVDTVLEVVTLTASDVKDSPDYGNSLDASFILGMAKWADEVLVLIDINKALSDQDKELIKQAT